MKYNIYLNSPQLAVNSNKKQYYLNIINNNKIIKPFNKTTLPQTSYSLIYYPNYIIRN